MIRALSLLAALLLAACANAPARDAATLKQEVAATERAFAKTMADRDHAAFAGFLDPETVFFGGKGPLHGRAEVAARWQGFFTEPQAPFSWEPKEVEVLPSGTLALTSGPVHDPSGKLIGTFTSIWRQQSPGVWKIIFDKGCEVCDCAKPQ